HSQHDDATTNRAKESAKHTVKREWPTIKSEKEGDVSPLIRFESAVIRYPLSSAPPPDCVMSDCDLNYDDCNGNNIDGDIILESQSKQQLLQRNWNQQQSDPTRENSHEFVDPSFDLNIWPNLECGSGGGGHVVLGRNGSGKSLLSRSLVHSLGRSASIISNHHNDFGHHDPTADNNMEIDNPYLQSGGLSMIRRNASSKNRNHHFLSHVSFDSHSDLLLNENTTTVHRALIPSGGNRLSPTAKFLAVRLGMYPLLPRHVNTLSTGEIRRVLLVRALVSKPELLILDNAFDGLDVHGRKGLQDIVERVLKGFRMDILVQGVGDAKDTARTQVLLLTHRPEEIADGVGRVTFMNENGRGARTEDRNGRNGEDLVRSLVSCSEYQGVADKSDSIAIHPWGIVSNNDFPSNKDISNFWEAHRKSRKCAKDTLNEDVVVHATDLTVARDEITLLSHLNWTVQRGERWHLAGTNGAGKSTLSRLLLRMSMNKNTEWNSHTNKDDALISDGSLVVTPSMASNARLKRGGISWVSTELHLHAAHNWGNRTVKEILLSGASFLFNVDKNREEDSVHGDPSRGSNSSSVDGLVAVTAACWLGLLGNVHSQNDNDITNHSFLSRQFYTLSQGEQKLLLVASAIAQRPYLLVLDEPCQGLDLWNRGHLLGLVERICRMTDMSLLYVTHHEEELIPSIGHCLCLDDGKVTHCGLR
ncbi:hypothetical protein ACHAXR_004502, partial [Thalassiosira sp. AJA248-18]